MNCKQPTWRLKIFTKLWTEFVRGIETSYGWTIKMWRFPTGSRLRAPLSWGCWRGTLNALLKHPVWNGKAEKHQVVSPSRSCGLYRLRQGSSPSRTHRQAYIGPIIFHVSTTIIWQYCSLRDA